MAKEMLLKAAVCIGRAAIDIAGRTVTSTVVKVGTHYASKVIIQEIDKMRSMKNAGSV